MARRHERVPLRLRAKFRSANSLLVAYTSNLSRGGVFLETTDLVAPGESISLEVTVPEARVVTVSGKVTWVREKANDQGPQGIGVRLDEVTQVLGELVDELVDHFSGVTVLVLCSHAEDRDVLIRMTKSIVRSADVVSANNAAEAEVAFKSNIDLVVVDIDEDDVAARKTMWAAQENLPRIPVVALASSTYKELARICKADGIIGNPPGFVDLQNAIVHALGKPELVS